MIPAMILTCGNSKSDLAWRTLIVYGNRPLLKNLCRNIYIYKYMILTNNRSLIIIHKDSKLDSTIHYIKSNTLFLIANYLLMWKNGEMETKESRVTGLEIMTKIYEINLSVQLLSETVYVV